MKNLLGSSLADSCGGLRNIQRRSHQALACLVLVGMGAARADFTGEFDASHWTLSNTLGPANTIGTVGGSVDTSPAGQVVLTGGNDAQNAPFDPIDPSSIFPNGQGTTAYSISIPRSGTLSFSWSYSTVDGPFYDPARYSLNGTTFSLTQNGDGQSQSGSVSIPVSLNDAFAFEVYTVDGVLGPGLLTISNFQLSPVPEPSEWAAISVGVLGLAWLGKRRMTAEAR